MWIYEHDILKCSKQIIDAELQAFKQRGDLERENEAHRKFAEDRSRHFISRQDILNRINNYLNVPQNNHPLK